MKFNWRGLIIWYLIFDLINDPLRNFLLERKAESLIPASFQELMIVISGHLAFFLFGAIAYAGLYYFFSKKQHLFWISFIVLSVLVPIAFRYLVQEVLFERLFGFTNYRVGYPIDEYVRDNLYFAFRYVTFGVIYFFVQLSFHKEKRSQQLTIENQKMELSLLRSQINPHFLLNSMNNIYSLIYHKSEKALEAMDTLTSVLKYSLYEQKEKVKLSYEIENVRKVIAINELRYDYPIEVNIEVSPDAVTKDIPPFIIIPLIENAFKHGTLQQGDSSITLKVMYSSGFLNTTVSNQKSLRCKDGLGGIGLDNIRKRLELLYADNHEFEITENGEIFQVRLSIPVA